MSGGPITVTSRSSSTIQVRLVDGHPIQVTEPSVQVLTSDSHVTTRVNVQPVHIDLAAHSISVTHANPTIVVEIEETVGGDCCEPRSIEASYDNDGRLEQVEYLDNENTIAVAYDGDGRLVLVTNNDNQTITTVTYDGDGRLSSAIVAQQ